MRFNQHKSSMPVFILLMASILGLAACKLTTNGGGFTPPPGGSSERLFATSKNQLWSFSVDSTTGALSGGTAITGPQLSYGVIADTARKFLYVTDSANDTVHVYSISSSGALAELGTSPYTVGTLVGGTGATGLAMDSAGKYLYVTDYGNSSVAGFTVNSSSGALTAMANSPFVTGALPTQIAVDASGKFAYVADFGSGVLGGLSAFTLGSGTGVLTPVPGSSPFTTVANGGPLGVATTGQFVFVSEQYTSNVAALTINSGTGGLSPVAGSPFAAGGEPAGTVLTPSGKYLYVANSQAGDNTISGYSVNSTTGVLTPISGSPFAATVSPWYLAVDPAGKFLYATNPGVSDNTITGFTINSSTGALTQFSGAATAVGTEPVGLTVVTLP